MVYVFTDLGIHVSTNDENVVLQGTTNKGGLLIIEGNEVRFFTNIGRAVAEDDSCAEVAIKRSSHNPQLYFLDVI